jgi:uncharacterized protein
MTWAMNMRKGARVLRFLLTGSVALFAMALATCGPSGPPPNEYVLGTEPPATKVASPVTERPIFEIAMVRIPDYLDRTDLLVRNGNQLKSSQSGRWGERLSLGITRALAASLAAGLPKFVVTTTPSVNPPRRKLLVDVTTFEARADRQVVLAARWTITDGSGRATLLSEQAVVVEPVSAMEDSSVVAAMTRAIENLADHIARQSQLSSLTASSGRIAV